MERVTRQVAQDRIHTLLVPLGSASLLVPSALVAEVINVGPLQTLPLSEPWLLGLMNWRSRPVPVVSFDILLGHPIPPVGPRAKIVIFYPLEGRNAYEFFGVITAAEPQPRTFHDGQALSQTVENTSPYLALTLQLDKAVAGIPNLEALRGLFYPQA